MTKAENKTTNRKDFWERNRLSEGYLLRKTITKWAIIIGRALLLFGMCFMIVQPILNKVSMSFMAEEDLYNTNVISIPEHFTTENYGMASMALVYPKTLKDTVILCLTSAILQVVMCTLVGYGFARFDFPLKKFWFGCVILAIIVPPQLISTSLHLHFRFFDLFSLPWLAKEVAEDGTVTWIYKTLPGIIQLISGKSLNLKSSMTPYYILSGTCMGLKNGLYIFLIRQFFRTIPKELEEAAYVDGCGTLRTFIRIMLPDAKPIITSCFLFSFVWQWTDGFYTRIFLPVNDDFNFLGLRLNQIGDFMKKYLLDDLTNTRGATTGYINCIVSTGTLMVIAPVLLIYLFAQKGFVESLSSSGIKM